MTETRKAFHDELDELHQSVVRLAAMAADAIEAGTDALLGSDLSAVEAVVVNDHDLDILTRNIELESYDLLARQQPMAIDLRRLVTIMRVIHELERIGDLMVNVAKAARRLYPHQLDPKVRGLVQRMREQAVVQLKIAVQAFAERNPNHAKSLHDMDDVMDELQKDLFRWIFAAQADEDVIQRSVQIALVGRYYERIADHAVNIGDRVEFMVTGLVPEE